MKLKDLPEELLSTIADVIMANTSRKQAERIFTHLDAIEEQEEKAEGDGI